MAKRAGLPRAPKVKTRPTGRFILCPASLYRHPVNVYVQILVKERHFYRCTCGTNVYLAPSWTDNDGLTYDQASQVPNATVYA